MKTIEDRWFKYFDEFLGKDWKEGRFDPWLTQKQGNHQPPGKSRAEVEAELWQRALDVWKEFYEGLKEEMLTRIKTQRSNADDWKAGR